MSNRISGANEVHISYSTDTEEYIPTYNAITVISDIAYDNKSTVSVSFDLSGLTATNVAAGASDKLESNEYSTEVGFTLTNTGSFRVNSGDVDSGTSKASRFGMPVALARGTSMSADVSYGTTPVLEAYSTVLVVGPVSDA